MADLTKLISDRPGFWVFLCVVVVVGGPTFLNQMAERYLPGSVQTEIANDIEWIERRSNNFTSILKNQKRILERLSELHRSVDGTLSDHVDYDIRVARLEAWRRFMNESMLKEELDCGVRC